ncbi:hypothetical protein EV702DRAFT_964237 [Suillus placidus]|uniref:SWIM-type domain-containing protein n=1 Tax=Suillus placidus TaxID=48579 RepID=A0A9P7A1B3_9AGAM|nr:hypothetical protein EV702DRAFT_964237 [Suillus placidus]
MHFSKPQVDLLIWILVVKLTPTYYKNIDHLLNDFGRFRELSSWRKEFKRDWLHAVNTPITAPLNPKYRPDPHRWVCTCPNLVKTRFLICKHLVQSVHPVTPTFFLEVQRNRTIPFWAHLLLVPLNSCPPPLATAAIPVPVPGPVNEEEIESGDEASDGVEDDLVDTFCQQLDTKTFQEHMLTHVKNTCDFCDGLEYQIQFNDYRMLTILERNGSSFLRLADNCLSRE